eukprot:15024-Heterocapsa_arctica.AAC.1
MKGEEKVEDMEQKHNFQAKKSRLTDIGSVREEADQINKRSNEQKVVNYGSNDNRAEEIGAERPTQGDKNANEESD